MACKKISFGIHLGTFVGRGRPEAFLCLRPQASAPRPRDVFPRHLPLSLVLIGYQRSDGGGAGRA